MPTERARCRSAPRWIATHNGAALAWNARLRGLAAQLGLDVELWRREGLEWVRDASGIERWPQVASERASGCGGGERRAWHAVTQLELGVPGASSAGGLPRFAWKTGCYIELSLANLPPSTSLAHKYIEFHREQLGFSMVALRPFRSGGMPFVLIAFARTPASPLHATSPPIISPIGVSVSVPHLCVIPREPRWPPESSDRTASSLTELAAPRSLFRFRIGLLAAELSGDVDVVDAGPESPTHIYLPVWHGNPEMTTGCAGWKAPSASLQRSPCCDPIGVPGIGTQFGPYEAAVRALCTGAQHLRPKIGMLTACCFPSEDGKLACAVLRGVKGATRGTYVQMEMATRQVQLKPGSHAFVRCVGERFLRVAVASASFGKASGHALLAAEGPVLYAGEVEVGVDGLTRWNNMSGTYRPSADDAGCALLPLDKLWRVVSEIGIVEPPTATLDSALGPQLGDQILHVGGLLLVSDLEWRRSFS